MRLKALTTEDGKFKITNGYIKVGEELVDLTSPSLMTLKNDSGEEFQKECQYVTAVTSQISFVCPTELIDMEK
jgi:hypothetical protein